MPRDAAGIFSDVTGALVNLGELGETLLGSSGSAVESGTVATTGTSRQRGEQNRKRLEEQESFLSGLETGARTGERALTGEETALGTKRATGRAEEFLEIDQAGIERIMSQVLGGAEGLAAVFSGEQTAGLFNTSVAAQASGNLLAQLSGEIAKLTAKKVSVTEEEEEEEDVTRKTEKEISEEATRLQREEATRAAITSEETEISDIITDTEQLAVRDITTATEKEGLLSRINPF